MNIKTHANLHLIFVSSLNAHRPMFCIVIIGESILLALFLLIIILHVRTCPRPDVVSIIVIFNSSVILECKHARVLSQTPMAGHLGCFQLL